MKLDRTSRALRVALLASAAGLSLGYAATASAQDVAGPRLSASEAERTAQGGGALIDANGVERAPHDYIQVKVDPEPEILIANPGTPTTARDPVNVTGIGQMVTDAGGGFIGLCTGTLINPRAVIFAAHCVNDSAATSYGANSGGTAIGFGFETNTRANAPGETDELVRWLLGSGANQAGRFQTNVAQAFYNVNQVHYNPYSLEPEANGFLYGDVAIATLDTPAANVPTWALLFSPLTNNTTIGAAGTGFNVGIVGYGNNGTGTGGASTQTDFRRRAAENVIGALTDLETFESFLFGGAPNGLKQNLYFMDFDDPRRGTGVAPSVFDFNAFRDNARPGTNGGPSREGITSQGDSGGPLILQNFSRQFVIGVLSGGYTRFFNGQPANGYGTVSFYQPLYLYWDYIAANNPYHYVSSLAGNANWTDASHWVTTLDPSYYVLGLDGQPVNGVPTVPGEQKNGTTGDFGQICFQSGGTSDCLDTRTGNEVVEVRPIGTADGQPANDVATATSQPALGRIDGAESAREAQGSIATPVLPAATVANGLPGATNFVPNNSDPIRLTGVAARYFDVSLIANGTTTLNSAVTIDRLTFGGNGATLAIANTGTLNSLINVNHFAGTLAVDGTLNSVGDYSFFGGLISGNGRINAPFLTSVTGQFAPGTVGTSGTLTVGGNLILSSASTYFVDLSNTGASDLISVRATTFNGNTPTNGQANVGGRLVVNFTNALRGGQTYTILTAEGGVTGTFLAPTAFSAILTPTVTYTATAVRLAVQAGSYASVINTGSGVQAAYANLLDRNRGNAGNFDGIYGPLDLQNAATIRSTLEGLAPTTETTVRGLGTAMTDTQSGLFRDRLQTLDIASAGGTMARIGQPMRVASTSVSSGNLLAPTMIGGGNEQTTVQEGALPENMSGFVAGGYVKGDSAAMPAAISTARDEFDGWYIAGGIETLIDDQSAIGFALSYSKMDSEGAVVGHSAKANLIQGTLYGKYEAESGFSVDAQISAGLLDTQTKRTVAFVGNNYTLKADDSALAVSTEAGASYKISLGNISLKPRAAWRSTYIDFSRTRETGGPVALVYNRQPVQSSQLRGGLTLAGEGMKVKPFVTGTYVHDFADRPAVFAANFVGSTASPAGFALSSRDREWAEVAGGLTVRTKSIDLSIAAETTIARKDVTSRSIRGSIGFHF